MVADDGALGQCAGLQLLLRRDLLDLRNAGAGLALPGLRRAAAAARRRARGRHGRLPADGPVRLQGEVRRLRELADGALAAHAAHQRAAARGLHPALRARGRRRADRHQLPVRLLALQRRERDRHPRQRHVHLQRALRRQRLHEPERLVRRDHRGRHEHDALLVPAHGAPRLRLPAAQRLRAGRLRADSGRGDLLLHRHARQRGRELLPHARERLRLHAAGLGHLRQQRHQPAAALRARQLLRRLAGPAVLPAAEPRGRPGPDGLLRRAALQLLPDRVGRQLDGRRLRRRGQAGQLWRRPAAHAQRADARRPRPQPGQPAGPHDVEPLLPLLPAGLERRRAAAHGLGHGRRHHEPQRQLRQAHRLRAAFHRHGHELLRQRLVAEPLRHAGPDRVVHGAGLRPLGLRHELYGLPVGPPVQQLVRHGHCAGQRGQLQHQLLPRHLGHRAPQLGLRDAVHDPALRGGAPAHGRAGRARHRADERLHLLPLHGRLDGLAQHAPALHHRRARLGRPGPLRRRGAAAEPHLLDAAQRHGRRRGDRHLVGVCAHPERAARRGRAGPALRRLHRRLRLRRARLLRRVGLDARAAPALGRPLRRGRRQQPELHLLLLLRAAGQLVHRARRAPAVGDRARRPARRARQQRGADQPDVPGLPPLQRRLLAAAQLAELRQLPLLVAELGHARHARHRARLARLHRGRQLHHRRLRAALLDLRDRGGLPQHGAAAAAGHSAGRRRAGQRLRLLLLQLPAAVHERALHAAVHEPRRRPEPGALQQPFDAAAERHELRQDGQQPAAPRARHPRVERQRGAGRRRRLALQRGRALPVARRRLHGLRLRLRTDDGQPEPDELFHHGRAHRQRLVLLAAGLHGADGGPALSGRAVAALDGLLLRARGRRDAAALAHAQPALGPGRLLRDARRLAALALERRLLQQRDLGRRLLQRPRERAHGGQRLLHHRGRLRAGARL